MSTPIRVPIAVRGILAVPVFLHGRSELFCGVSGYLVVKVSVFALTVSHTL